MIQIHNGDNLEVLSKLGLDLSRCIFVTDPRFNIGYRYNEYEDKMNEEEKKVIRTLIQAFILKKHLDKVKY